MLRYALLTSSIDIIYYKIDQPNTEEEYEGWMQLTYLSWRHLLTAVVRALLMLPY